jgi:hypothetical protein
MNIINRKRNLYKFRRIAKKNRKHKQKTKESKEDFKKETKNENIL